MIYEVVLEKRNGALGIVTSVSISLKILKYCFIATTYMLCFLFGGFFLAVGIIFKEKVTHFVLSD